VKFSLEAVSKVLWSICEFCENRCSEDHTFLEGVNEICPISYVLDLIWIEFGRGDVDRN
jgi:hypothetical protein